MPEYQMYTHINSYCNNNVLFPAQKISNNYDSSHRIITCTVQKRVSVFNN